MLVEIPMRTTVAVLCLVSVSAAAQPKPGQYVGVRDCTGTIGDVTVDATSKKTIGVATCKTELGKKLVEAGACTGQPRGTRVAYSYKFGKDNEPDQATGSAKLWCP
jgi:hypothetical protein